MLGAFSVRPAELTSAQRMVLLILAEDARDGSCRSSPGLAKLTPRAGLKSRSQIAAVLKDLEGETLSLIRQVERGRKGHNAVYELLFAWVDPSEQTDSQRPVGRTQSGTGHPAGAPTASGGPDASRDGVHPIGSGPPDAAAEVTGELRPVGGRIASGGPDPSQYSSQIDKDQIGNRMIQTIIAAVHERTGVTITPEWAGTVHDLILGGRAVGNPAAYILRTINSESDPRGRFLPAVANGHAPPNVRRMCRDHGQHQPCPVCADHAYDAAAAAS